MKKNTNSVCLIWLSYFMLVLCVHNTQGSALKRTVASCCVALGAYMGHNSNSNVGERNSHDPNIP